MSFLVREIKDKEGMNDFLSIPSEIYRNDPNWIAPRHSELLRVLDPLKNPYFANASLRIYVCYSNGKPLCRSILVINHLQWQRWNKKSAFFGFVESVNDFGAFKCLFDRLESESRESGAEYLEGPFNPNHYSELGILIDNFNSAPKFFETYNPAYYPDLLNAAGFSEQSVFNTMINNNISETLSKKFNISKRHPVNREIVIRKFNIFRFKRDLEILRDINNDAFDGNNYFLPLSGEEYKFSAKFLFFVTTPGLILIAEFNGMPVGAVQLVLNLNSLIKSFHGRIMPWHIPGFLWKRRKLKELVIFSAGTKKEFRKTRVFAEMLKSAIKIFRGFSSLSTTWISDEKIESNLSQLLELKTYKHFAIYSKHL